MTPTSLNHEEHRRITFLKSRIIKDGHVEFSHLGKDYRVTSPCFARLEGCAVLIDAGLSVFRGGVKIGEAQSV